MVLDEHGAIIPLPDLSVTFDKHFQQSGTPPRTRCESLPISSTIHPFRENPKTIAERYGWEPRRLNPALSYLINRKLIDSVRVLAMALRL